LSRLLHLSLLLLPPLHLPLWSLHRHRRRQHPLRWSPRLLRLLLLRLSLSPHHHHRRLSLPHPQRLLLLRFVRL
jgi:hypothetical protein